MRPLVQRNFWPLEKTGAGEISVFFFFFLNDTLYSAEEWKMGQGGIVLRLRWGCTVVI